MVKTGKKSTKVATTKKELFLIDPTSGETICDVVIANMTISEFLDKYENDNKKTLSLVPKEMDLKGKTDLNTFKEAKCSYKGNGIFEVIAPSSEHELEILPSNFLKGHLQSEVKSNMILFNPENEYFAHNIRIEFNNRSLSLDDFSDYISSKEIVDEEIVDIDRLFIWGDYYSITSKCSKTIAGFASFNKGKIKISNLPVDYEIAI